MKHHTSPFKWRHYAPDIILLCVRWYCRYQLSYRDVEEMMRARSRRVKYPNNVIEQNRRFIKKKVRASMDELANFRTLKYFSQHYPSQNDNEACAGELPAR